MILTMYAAGIDPFADSLAALRRKAGTSRHRCCAAERDRTRLGINLVSGFLRLGSTMFSVHYPQTAQRVIIQREIDCAQSAMLGSGCPNRRICCAGAATQTFTAHF
ncbi:MAG: hypothetical protein ACLR4Z_00410 [Butyricicoccaceae bacterium]